MVVNEPGIVLGLLRKSMWEHAADDMTAEQAMESGPITFRPHVRRDEMVSYLQEKKIPSALVTTSDGKLVGLLRRKDLEESLARACTRSRGSTRFRNSCQNLWERAMQIVTLITVLRCPLSEEAKMVQLTRSDP